MKAAVLAILTGLTLSACAAKHELPMPTGEWHALNPGKWTFNPNDLTTVPPGQSGTGS